MMSDIQAIDSWLAALTIIDVKKRRKRIESPEQAPEAVRLLLEQYAP